MTDPGALEAIAVRAATAAAELDAVEHLEAHTGDLEPDALEALSDRRTCVELELADLTAELHALDAEGGPPRD
jgi:hypothetical protein